MSWWSDILAVYAVSEVAFYIWFRYRLSQSQGPGNSPAVSFAVRDSLVTRTLQLAKKYGVKQVLSGWFIDPSTGEPPICGKISGNIDEFLSWAFSHKKFHALSEKEQAWVKKTEQRIINEFPYEIFTPEKNGKLIAHTIDPVIAQPRPLIMYAFIASTKIAAYTALLYQGFRIGKFKQINYWYKTSKPERVPLKSPVSSPISEATTEIAEDSEPNPFLNGNFSNECSDESLVFFHGIGPGLAPYLSLVRHFPPNALIIELPWVAMSLGACPPTDAVAWTDEVLQLFDKLGFRRIILAGHSYGSVPIAWLLRRRPDLNCRVVLIDPVTLYLNTPKVCYSFLYEQPKSATMRFVRKWAAEEFGISYTLRRAFFWTDCVMFAEDLPSGSHVFLSGNDHIVPVDIVREECMKACHITTHVFDKAGHGWPCIFPSYAKIVAKAINNTDK